MTARTPDDRVSGYLPEVDVHYRGDKGDEKVDRYRDARYFRDAAGWVVIRLSDGRGTYRYPPESVIKMREFGDPR